MELKLATLLLSLTFCMSAFAFGNNQGQSQDQSQGQNQGQAQQANAAAIAAAAASNSTVVDMTSVNVIKTDIDNTNVNVAKGGDGGNAKAQGGDAYSGSKSRSNSGGNKISNSVNIEGDTNEYPAASAMAGIATDCVSTLAAQSQAYGISLGGESSDCKALRTALSFFQLASSFEASDPEMAEYYVSEGHKFAKLSGVSTITLRASEARGFLVDVGISAFIIKVMLATVL